MMLRVKILHTLSELMKRKMSRILLINFGEFCNGYRDLRKGDKKGHE